MICDIAILAGSVLLLWFGAKYLVDSAGRIAGTLGVSDLVIGLTVVAVGTSAPEFAVTVGAALKSNADISVGNIVGSNIFNLGFILGTVALVRPIDASRRIVYRDGGFLILVTFLLLFFFSDLVLQRIEGIVLMALLAGYMAFLFMKKEAPETGDIPPEKAAWKDLILLPAGIGSVILGGHLLVESAVSIAAAAGISKWVIGVTVVAAGTSAPEMATSLAAAVRGKHGMSAGNLIGSDIFNILGVLGLAGTLGDLNIAGTAARGALGNPGFQSLLMLSGMVILVTVFMRTGWKISRMEGAVLIGIALARWLFDFRLISF